MSSEAFSDKVEANESTAAAPLQTALPPADNVLYHNSSLSEFSICGVSLWLSFTIQAVRSVRKIN